ncbi:ammonia-forming cytochrome c nitrite reductase [Solitalea longa]|uniref:nitrite reductase (cytochrome; ammonia-forming) n=1 Tax=Solitalea longa TaxID=2079460 RepID=A0A2S4ZX50_9SPHI|nr:ammonia-forming cytochrome c nitrite reductase [Solitalea longa]POY34885.1 ammonia-forming cytochrome c nitrite reductase [Solitalea longa]
MKNWILFLGTIVVTFLLAMLVFSIMNRKTEAKFAYHAQVAIEGIEPRDTLWGLNYPRQYQSYQKTKDTTFKSMYNTSGFRDALAENPETIILWAGYAFSKGYNQPRGHNHAVRDVLASVRIGAPKEPGGGVMPSTCWTCKSPDVPRLMKEIGVTQFYSKKLSDFGSQIINPIGCADCHDPQTMNLTITRPALIEAFQSMGKNINQASHQEMRSLVCAQCHVEYYFDKTNPTKKGAQYLTFPWKNGYTVEDMIAYYDSIGFADWVHPLSKAKMLKAQHPDYEIYTFGVHAKRGVSCADCHMPYGTEGGQKFTDHHIGSPLANVENSCFVCHRTKVEDLVSDVYERQGKVKESISQLQRHIAMAHLEAEQAWKLGATEAQMKNILLGIRHAQFRWDYVAASHGAGFHAPLESSRILAAGTAIIQDARIELARLLATLGYNQQVKMPDLNSKSALQAYIGVNLEKEKMDKADFLEQVVPKWLKEGKEREARKKVTMLR